MESSLSTYCAPAQQPLKSIFHQTKSHFVLMKCSNFKGENLMIYQLLKRCSPLSYWFNKIPYFQTTFVNYIRLAKSLLWSYYFGWMSINDSYICYHPPSLAPYPKDYKSILLIDFVTITIYRLTILNSWSWYGWSHYYGFHLWVD